MAYRLRMSIIVLGYATLLVLLSACQSFGQSDPTRVAPAALPPSIAPQEPENPAVATATLMPQSSPMPAVTATHPPVATQTESKATATPLPAPSRPHYTFTVSLDYEAHFLNVEETVRVRNESADDWTELVFNVSAAYWDQLFSLERVQVRVAEAEYIPTLSWEQTMLRVSLAEALKSGTEIAIQMEYGLALPFLDPLGWGPQGNAGWSEELMQIGDWYPALVPYRDHEGWQTWQYHPVGDPVRNDLADFDVTVLAPPEVTIAAAGFRSEANGLRHFQLRRARAFAFLASPDYVRFQTQAGGIPVSVFVLSQHSSMGQVVAETAAQSLAFFSEIFGPYPYQEFVIAENGFLTAMEYSALVSQSGYAFDTYEGRPDSLLVSITAHEVAHQWWYGAVGNDQVDEPWLDEALAMMSELLFYEQFYPDLVEWWWFYRVDRWEPAGPIDVSVYEFKDSPTFVHNMYGMAARFMSDLRSAMGPADFSRFLQAYYAAHRHDQATTESFFTVALEFLETQTLRDVANAYFRKLPTVLMR